MSESYFHRVNAHLVSALQNVENERVLEIGCAAGELGALIKEQTTVHWTGIEVDESSGKEALEKLDEVYTANIETDALPLQPASYDRLVLGDVLEHLRDPWSCLSTLCTFLKPDARVVCSLPNINHWTVLVDLLGGRFTYQDHGILDRTHLRFFTLRESLSLFEKARLRIEKVESIEVEDPRMDHVVTQLGNLRNVLGIENKEFEREARTFQWLIHARWPGN